MPRPATWMRAARQKESAATRVYHYHPASGATLIAEAAGFAVRALVAQAGREASPLASARALWLDLESRGEVPRSPDMERRLRLIEELADRVRRPSDDLLTPDETVSWNRGSFALQYFHELAKDIDKLLPAPEPTPPETTPDDAPAP